MNHLSLNPRFFRRLIFVAALGLPTLISAENSPEQMFVQANQMFERGDWDKALEIYQSLVRQGYEGTSLYYNLGNLYYRKGERGKAILWYERAAQLSPRDSDVRFNLALARSHIRDEHDSLVRRVLLYFTANELSWTALLFGWAFFLVMGALTLGKIKGEIWPYVHLWLTGIMLFSTTGLLGLNMWWGRMPFGIVVAPPGEVRNGPGTDYAVGFTIPEGSKIIILNKRPEWIQVGVPQQGLKGWMPSQDVESITANPALSN